jgi:thioredoxin reductase (NADPH)
VYIVHRRDEFRAARVLQERAFFNPKIEVLWNQKVLEMLGDGKGLRELSLEHSVTGERSRLPVTGAFVFIGFTPNTGLVKQHLEHDAAGYIITNERMETSLPGLYAAGDLRSQLTRQVTTAVGDATTAAIAVEKFLAARKAEEKIA